MIMNLSEKWDNKSYSFVNLSLQSLYDFIGRKLPSLLCNTMCSTLDNIPFQLLSNIRLIFFCTIVTFIPIWFMGLKISCLSLWFYLQFSVIKLVFSFFLRPSSESFHYAHSEGAMFLVFCIENPQVTSQIRFLVFFTLLVTKVSFTNLSLSRSTMCIMLITSSLVALKFFNFGICFDFCLLTLYFALVESYNNPQHLAYYCQSPLSARKYLIA